MQATSNGNVSQPKLNADLVGDLLALDDAPSTEGNASAAVDLLADLLGDTGGSLNASGVVSGGSQVLARAPSVAASNSTHSPLDGCLG